MAFPYLALAAVLLHRGCGQGNSGGGVSTRCQRAGGVRKTRRHLCVDARGLQRHGKALLDRRPRRPLGKPQRRRALGLLDEFGLRRLAVDGVEQVLGIRPDERRVGKEGVSNCRSRWWAVYLKQKKNTKYRY